MKAKHAQVIVLLLALEVAGPASADDFQIGMRRTNSVSIELQVPPATDSYFIAYSTSVLTGNWQKVNVRLGTPLEQMFPVTATSSLCYYLAGKRPLADPGDADADGLDDVYELRNAPLNALDSADTHQDFDGDGYDNFAEYQVGANPNGSNPAPVIAISYPRNGTRLP